MDIQQAILQAAVEQLKNQLHERVGSIRHPTTGESPTLVVEGDSLDSLTMRIEGSPELLELVKSRLGAEAEGVGLVSKDVVKPHVFLSYTTADRDLAESIANALMAQGIETWWDKWEVRSGDSLRQKIDSGIGGCTHFLVLLTPSSIDKPWVNAELDAAFVRKVSDECKLIPLRHQLEASALPPLLRGLSSPVIDAEASQIQQLINDIHGISAKPLLGNPPTAVRNVVSSGYTAAATAVVKVFVERSEYGISHETQIPIEDLAKETDLTLEDLEDAIHELRNFVVESFGVVRATRDLYAEFDQHWKPWNPAADAREVAARMINEADFTAVLKEIAERMHWSPRRLNAAASYLARRRVVDFIDTLDSHPFAMFRVMATGDTRRFVKSRS